MLGYALTHPRRLHAALGAGADRTRFEEAVEAAVGLMRTGPTDMAQAWLTRQRNELEGLHDRLAGASQAFAPVAGFFAGLGDLGTLPTRLAALAEATDPENLKRAIGDMLEAVLGALLPGGTDPGEALRERVLGVFDLMEAPFRAGSREPPALRGFRAAASCRRLVRPLFATLALPGPAADLGGALRAALDQAFEGLQAQQLRDIAGQLRLVAEQVGPLMEAVGRISVSVEVRADGPQGAPGANATWRDDKLPVPHAALGHPLTITEIIVALVQLAFGFWEMFRTRDWQGRPANVFPHVLGMLWHIVRSCLRIFAPGTINGMDSSFARWLFTDQGDFWIQIILRLSQTIYDFAQAPNNGFLGVGAALLKQHAFMGLPRLVYQFARAVWYFDQRKTDNAGRNDVSPTRYMMGLWGPTSFLALLWGMLPTMPWDGFALELLTRQAGTMVLLVLGLLLAVASGYFTLAGVSGENPFKFSFDFKDDVGTIATAAAAAGIGILAALLIMASIESPTKVGVVIALAVLMAGVAGLGIALAVLIAKQDSDASGTFAAFTMFLGLLGPGLITIVMGWFIVDDGRDKPGYFEPLTADDTPYHLPYRAGEGWLVGQGVHGIFSHYDGADGSLGASSNHWSYDFNRDENSVALATRDGIVVQADTPNPNGTSTQNAMQFMNLGWKAKHDPGTPDEGVLTWTIYVHLSQHRHYASLGQRTPHGLHVADIDDTGRSAQHHLHAGVYDMQSGRKRGIPFVFADASTKQRRGFGHHDGKPISFGMYESSHAEAPAPRAPATLVADTTTPPAATGLTAHTHELRLDGASLPDPLVDTVLTTEPSAGHVHQVPVTAAQLEALLKKRLPPGGLSTATALDHTHALSLTVPNQEALNAMVALVAPPDARLVAKQPGPYRLLGERLTLRVNGRATAFWMFGAHRPSLVADVPLDGGVPSGAGLALLDSATTPPSARPSVTLPNAQHSASAREAAAELTRLLRSAGAAQAHVGAEPVLVLESLRRGGGVNLVAEGAAALALAGAAPAPATGSGALADHAAIPRADFAAHIAAILRDGWGAPLKDINVDANSPMRFDVGGAAVALNLSGARNKAVLEKLYDPATQRLRADGPLPLGEGRIGIAPLTLAPLLVRPARAVLDLAHASMTGDARAAKPLDITVGGAAPQKVRLVKDGTAAQVAAAIMQGCEGVRAFADGATRVVIETLAAGSAATITLAKDGANPATSTPGASAAPAIASTAAMTQVELRAVLLDSKARASNDPAVAAATPLISIGTAPGEEGRLVLAVNADKRIAVTAWELPGLANPGFGAAAARLVSTNPLPATIALTGTGWIDLTVDGKPVRVPFDAAPARLEIPFSGALPAAGSSLTLRTTGVTTDATVRFTTAPGSLFEVAERITEAAPGVVARLAWRLVVERAGWGQVNPAELALGEPTGTAGLAALGMLRPVADLRAGGAGPGADPLLLPAPLPQPDEIVHGKLLRAPTPPGQSPPSVGVLNCAQPEPPAGTPLSFSVEAGSTINAVAAPAVGPLSMTAAGTTASTGNLPNPFALGGFHQRVRLTASTGTVVIATTWLALDAAPAVLAATDFPTLPPLVPARLGIALAKGAAPATSASLALDGIATPAVAVAALNAAHPGLRAVLRADGRIALETRQGGSAMRLTLSGQAALLALGFAPTPAERAADAMVAKGAGNVADGTAVTRAELKAAVEAALAAVTLPGPVAGVTPWPFTVNDDSTSLRLRAPGGIVRLESDTDAPDPDAFGRQRGLVAALLAPVATDAAGTPLPGGTRLAALDGAASVALPEGLLMIATPGGLGAVVALHGESAQLRADNPLPATGTPEITALAAALQASSFGLSVDGAPGIIGPMPATVAATPEAITRFIADAAPSADVFRDAAGHLVLASRLRGSASALALDLSALAALVTPLGFSAVGGSFVFTATRTGSLDPLARLDRVDRAAMRGLLNAAQAEGAAPQGVLHADAPSLAGVTQLRLTAGAPGWQLRVATTHPDLPVLASAPGTLDAVLQAPFAGARRVGSGMMVLAVTQSATAPPRLMRVPLWGRPASLVLRVLPAGLPLLAGKRLLFALDGAGFSTAAVTFDALPDIATLCRRVTEGTNGVLLARPLGPETLAVETAKRGRNARLVAIPGDAITGNPATGLAVVGDRQARGWGSLPDLDATTAQDVANAINAGWLTQNSGTAADEPERDRVRLPPLPYGHAQAANLAVLASRRRGAEGSLVPIAPATMPEWLDGTLAAGPAVRAALVTKSLALPADGTRISGTLELVLNDNGSATGLPAREAVSVVFADGTWKPDQVAAHLHAALAPRGLGSTLVHADGRIAIEVAATGVAGSIAAIAPVPAPTAPHPFAVLIEPDFAADRGWPGAGRIDPGQDAAPGWRARHAGPAAAAATWSFARAGTPPTPLLSFPVAAGTTQAAIADALDTALANVLLGGTARRIGVARLDPAGHLLIEMLVASATLDFGGAPPTDPGMRPGAQWEAAAEPALGLAATDWPRTVRLARDPNGSGDPAQADDWTWIRLPTGPDGRAIVNGTSRLRAKAFRNDDTKKLPNELTEAEFEIAQLPLFPPGRYYVAVRAEAARDATGAYLPLVTSGRGLAALRTWPGMTLWGQLRWVALADQASRFDPPGPTTMPLLRVVQLPDGTAAAEFAMPLA